MNTNFFNQIAELDIQGNLHLTIAKGAENNLIVSVLLQNDGCADKAKDLILPYVLRATADELDKEFFTRITAPVQTTSRLIDNMEAYMKQLEEAQKQSAMEKQKSEKEKKEKDEKEKKYKEVMQKVDELEKNGKYRDAWTKLPDPTLFPEQAEAIRKRRTMLSGKFAPDLFGDAKTVTTDEPQEDNPSLEDRPEDELPNDEDEA